MESKLIPTLICVALVVLFLGLMYWGWKSRQQRQNTVGKLAEVPARFDDETPVLSVEGTYVSTTMMGDWLDRVAVETLGYKSLARLLVYRDGLIFNREGAKDVWIPREDLIGVRTEAGMSGKFVEKNGLLVVSWELNGTALDTGFRTQIAEEKQAAQEAITALLDTTK